MKSTENIFFFSEKRIMLSLFALALVLILSYSAEGFTSIANSYSLTSNPSFLAIGSFRRNANALFTSTIESAISSDIQEEKDNEPIGTITFLVPPDADTKISKFGRKSPVQSPTILEAAQHLTKKAFWFSDGKVEASIVRISNDLDKNTIEKLYKTNVLVAIGITADENLSLVEQIFAERRKHDDSLRDKQYQIALDCAKVFKASVGPFDELNPPILSVLPWTRQATGKRLAEQMMTLFERWTSDDFIFAILLFLNQFSGSEVDWVKHSIDATWEKGPIRNAQEFYAMVSKCGDCIVKCVADDNCRACITKLTAIDTRDQVASYRTIVSHESQLLNDFSLCILTKNNIFNCDATIPTLPKVPPIQTWREMPLTEETARSILVGHLDDPAAFDSGLKLPVSWKVVCGANEAYDQFPSQNQIFYPAIKGRDMWYDPVFRVKTLDDRDIWCKRHYKVRPQKTPGTFRFSVLDNGVTSDEFWTIVGVANDLSWIVFHYAGAASSVGQRYLGGLLCTADGNLPDESKMPLIWDTMKSAGIEPWDLYLVDNDPNSPGAIAAGEPPLDYFRRVVLEKRANS